MINQIKTIKTVHIHSDFKFINNTGRFLGDYFDNTIIYIGTGQSCIEPNIESVKYFNSNQVNKVIEACMKADLVVLYNLDTLKIKIALSLPNDIKIAWRFFGTELYSRMNKVVLSPKSQKYLPENRSETFEEKIKAILRPFYHKIKHEIFFQKAMKRIDYMMVLSEKEYIYLSEYWPNLPSFIELNISIGGLGDKFHISKFTNKTNKIVLGNSRSIFNNHIDMIDLIEKSSKKDNYQFAILFNYGLDGAYAQAIREAVIDKPYFSFNDKYMSTKEFNSYYLDVSALVINSYRQMAMGNIFLALSQGVKVYFNKKNIMMEWLLENKIKVFSIDSLLDDIENDNISLDKATIYHNYKLLNLLCEPYSNSAFQENVYQSVFDSQLLH